ncbi:MAG: kelch repeat-containing protein [Acidimicrobiales bacterium]
MATAPIAGRSGAAVVWTGDELLIWGGYVYDGRERPLDDGAAYDPITDSWRTLPAAPIAGRAYPPPCGPARNW